MPMSKEERRRHDAEYHREARKRPEVKEREKLAHLKYRATHYEECLERDREYYRKHRKECISRTREYYRKNPDRYKEQTKLRMRKCRLDPMVKAKEKVKAKEYYYKNRDKMLDYRKIYCTNNKDKVNKLHREYMTNKKEMRFAINQANYYYPIISNCEVCGSEHRLQHHHENYAEPLNVITVCQQCHTGLTVNSINV